MYAVIFTSLRPSDVTRTQGQFNGVCAATPAAILTNLFKGCRVDAAGIILVIQQRRTA